MGRVSWINEIPIPSQSIGGSIEFLDQPVWNLKITNKHEGDNYWLYSGEKLLFDTTKKEEMEAFIFGMTISLVVLPENIIDQIKSIGLD